MAEFLNFLMDPNERKKILAALLDSANRGMVAGTLGAPVDVATQAANLGIAGAGYAGHKLGLLNEPPELIDPSRAIGSSEWIGRKMQERGIVSPNRNEIAEMGMAMLSPVAARGAGAVGRGVAKADLAAAENAAKAGRVGPISGQRGSVTAGSGKLYHVAPEGHKGDILSLYKQYGDDAYGLYAKKWPESGNLGQEHAHFVHLHQNLDEAKKYAKQYGGKIYEVDAEKMADDWIDVVQDQLEYKHPMVRDAIPSEYIRQVK